LHGLDAEERAAPDAHLAAAWKSVQAANVRPADELLSELRTPMKQRRVVTTRARSAA
jgi:hypothetical protein